MPLLVAFLLAPAESETAAPLLGHPLHLLGEDVYSSEGTPCIPTRWIADVGSLTRRLSAGIFSRSTGTLVRQLCHNKAVDRGEPLVLDWDGFDFAGAPVLTSSKKMASYELRFLDVSSVMYEWQGVIGNTGPATGVDVQISLKPFRGTAIAGNYSVTAVGYSEGHVGTTMSPLESPSKLIPIGHSDFTRDFSIPATDGEVGYFANTAVVTCDNASAFWTATTYVAAWDLRSGCEHSFTKAGLPDCSHKIGGRDCPAGSFDGCQGKGYYFHSVIDREFDPATVNDTVHRRALSTAPDKDGCGTDFLRSPTGLAVQRSPSMMLFIAHAYLNQVRVVHKLSGQSICNVTMEWPRQLAVSADGSSLWAIVRNSTVAKFDTTNMPLFCEKGRVQQPVPELTLDADAVSAPAGLIAVSPKDGSIAVCDMKTSQVVLFSSDGQLIRRLGTLNGYADGNVTVDASKFFWTDVDPVWVAFEDDGTLWVMDSGNQRSLHLTPQGSFLGARQHLPASYTMAVSGGDPTRVFSNFLEFKVGYSGPLNKSWSLVRNWAAGVNTTYRKSGGVSRSGFHSVQVTPDKKHVGLVHRMNSETQRGKRVCCHVGQRWSASCTECHGNGDVCQCLFLNETKLVQQTVLVELAATGIVPLLVLNQTIAGSAMLHEGGVIRYSITQQLSHSQNKSQNAHLGEVQAVYESPYVAGARTWRFPGDLLSSFAFDNTSLASRVSGSVPTFPLTSTGELVVFDANDGHRPGKDGLPYPYGNHGNHLGVVSHGEHAAWKWQSSPWGTWAVGNQSEVLDGVHGTRWFITADTMDGRFGANDTVQYAGSNAHTQGSTIVYGFPGEFFHQAEASQWLHFHDSGLFVGQFGTLNIGFVTGGITAPVHYALNGTSGNAYAPQLTAGPDGQYYLYHNDENAHDGVHRWLLRGANQLKLRTAASSAHVVRRG